MEWAGEVWEKEEKEKKSGELEFAKKWNKDRNNKKSESTQIEDTKQKLKLKWMFLRFFF